MGIPSIKKVVITRLLDDWGTGEHGCVSFVTPFGIVNGFPILKGEDCSMAKFITALSSTNPTDGLDGDDGAFTLKNVTIRSGLGDTTRYSQLVIFYDQIIGITFDNP